MKKFEVYKKHQEKGGHLRTAHFPVRPDDGFRPRFAIGHHILVQFRDHHWLIASQLSFVYRFDPDNRQSTAFPDSEGIP